MKNDGIKYREALKKLYRLQKFGIKFGLSKTSNLMHSLGDPHLGRPYIHIAGTNGKGSVAAMAASVLEKAGYRVGLYSSPHLVRFTERFKINGREMSTETAASLAQELLDVIDPREPPTFFEIVTAMALVHFAREAVDVAIMEVGMGGRLDATNVISPLVTAITNISLEHQDYLGRRLVDIAGEKAGIIKENIELVTGVTQPRIIELYEHLCREKHVPLTRIGKDVRYRCTQKGLSYSGTFYKLKGLTLGLQGKFQSRNAAIALAVLEGLRKKGILVHEDHLRTGLAHVSWPGRMQLMGEKPAILVDGGHNPRAVRALAETVPKTYSYSRLILVLGVMADKDIPSVVRGIVPIADYVIYTRPVYSRAADPHVLLNAAASLGRPGETAPDLLQALDKAKKIADADDLILITGSLFTAGEALSHLDPERYRPDGI